MPSTDELSFKTHIPKLLIHRLGSILKTLPELNDCRLFLRISGLGLREEYHRHRCFALTDVRIPASDPLGAQISASNARFEILGGRKDCMSFFSVSWNSNPASFDLHCACVIMRGFYTFRSREASPTCCLRRHYETAALILKITYSVIECVLVSGRFGAQQLPRITVTDPGLYAADFD